MDDAWYELAAEEFDALLAVFEQSPEHLPLMQDLFEHEYPWSE